MATTYGLGGSVARLEKVTTSQNRTMAIVQVQEPDSKPDGWQGLKSRYRDTHWDGTGGKVEVSL